VKLTAVEQLEEARGRKMAAFAAFHRARNNARRDRGIEAGVKSDESRDDRALAHQRVANSAVGEKRETLDDLLGRPRWGTMKDNVARDRADRIDRDSASRTFRWYSATPMHPDARDRRSARVLGAGRGLKSRNELERCRNGAVQREIIKTDEQRRRGGGGERWTP